MRATMPKFQKVADDIRGLIADGTYPVGSRLPPRQQLCEQYQCTQVTIRSGLQTLVNEGLLRVRQGRRPLVLATPGTVSPDLPRRWSAADLLTLLAQLRQLCEEWTAAAAAGALSPELLSELPFLAIEIQIMVDRLQQQRLVGVVGDTDQVSQA